MPSLCACRARMLPLRAGLATIAIASPGVIGISPSLLRTPGEALEHDLDRRPAPAGLGQLANLADLGREVGERACGGVKLPRRAQEHPGRAAPARERARRDGHVRDPAPPA